MCMESRIYNSHLETSFDRLFSIRAYISLGPTLKQIFLMGLICTSELLSIYECVALSEINVNF